LNFLIQNRHGGAEDLRPGPSKIPHCGEGPGFLLQIKNND